MFEVLPSRTTLHATEALDCYLERLAQANELSTSSLYKFVLRSLDFDATALAFLMVSPHPAVLRVVSGLGGVDCGALRSATLMRYDGGLPLRLDGLDPGRTHSFRRGATQGWFPRHGSQACPMCLADNGIWKVEWRLPIVAVCRTHGVYLLTECAACRQRFRIRRRNPMRPELGPQQLCGNPIGRRRPCSWPIATARPSPATPSVVAAAQTIALAMAGKPVAMLGHTVDPRTYLAEIRNVATLLLHVKAAAAPAQTSDQRAAGWLDNIAHTTFRSGRRWGISPPASSSVRAVALAGAESILGQPTLVEAGAQLASWLAPLSSTPNGHYNWLINRTVRTDTTKALVCAALTGRHHVARRVSSMRIRRPLAACAIPQMIDQEVFSALFAGLFGGYAWAGRRYVSLCVARAATGVTSWSAAAAQLGIPSAIGDLAARTARRSLRATPEAVAESVSRTLLALPRDRDFRDREARVAHLAANPSWFASWRTSVTPARQSVTLLYAITWMWCEVAYGLLETSPVSIGSPAPPPRARYREFRNRLQPAAQIGLRALVLDDARR